MHFLRKEVTTITSRVPISKNKPNVANVPRCFTLFWFNRSTFTL